MWKRIEAIILVVILCSKLVNGGSIVPCYFIFGDSLSDAGNNNDLVTMAKVNYSPYGIDFPQGIATGRFTNGRTIADFITEFLGFEKFITPATTQTDEDILRGVNYASGAAGILEETSSHLGDRIWMDRQLRNYDNTISKLESMIEGPVSEYLKKCLFTVNIGSNDYINNYFMPQHYNTKNLFTSDEYAQLLVSRYQPQLQAIYDSGARKVAIFGLGKIGCIPAELAMNNATKCVDEINQAVNIFNNKLKKLVDYFNANLPGAKFTFINLYAMQSLSPIGLISSSPCCKVLRSDYQCEPNSKPCRNRNLHAYMDGFHPTEFVNRFAATISFGTLLPLFVHPLNISQLVKIDINNNNVLQI